jgi:hypothetical protein
MSLPRIYGRSLGLWEAPNLSYDGKCRYPTELLHDWPVHQRTLLRVAIWLKRCPILSMVETLPESIL